MIWSDPETGTAIRGVITDHKTGKPTGEGKFTPKGKSWSELTDKEKAELIALLEDEKRKVRSTYHSMVAPHPASELLARAAPIDRDLRFTPTHPHPGGGSGADAGVNMPPIAGAHAEIFGTIVAANEPVGPKAFYVGTVDYAGHKTFYASASDALGHLHFKLPSAANVASVLVFRAFDRNGKPDSGGTIQVTDAPAHIPNTLPLANTAVTGPQIIEANTAYELGGQGQGLVYLQVRNVDPREAVMLVDGSARDADILAASDRSIVAKLHDTIGTGPHVFGVRSGPRPVQLSSYSDQTVGGGGRPVMGWGGRIAYPLYSADVVRLRFDPFGPLKIGESQTITLHVTGVPADQDARAVMSVTGGAALEGGGNAITVPVQTGIAQIRIRAIAAGKVAITATVTVQLPDFRAHLKSPAVFLAGSNAARQLDVSVDNTGKPLQEPLGVDVFLSNSKGEIFVYERTSVMPLPAGASTIVVPRFALPADLRPGKDYRTCVLVDPHSVQPESNKSNNESCAPVVVATPRPGPTCGGANCSPPPCEAGPTCGKGPGCGSYCKSPAPCEAGPTCGKGPGCGSYCKSPAPCKPGESCGAPTCGGPQVPCAPRTPSPGVIGSIVGHEFVESTSDCDAGRECLPRSEWTMRLPVTEFDLRGPSAAKPGDPVDITLNVRSTNRSPVISVPDYRGCLISEIGFPQLDASSKDPCYLSITFEPERIRNATPSPTTSSARLYQWNSLLPGGLPPGTYYLCVSNPYETGAATISTFAVSAPSRGDPCHALSDSVPLTKPYEITVQNF